MSPTPWAHISNEEMNNTGLLEFQKKCRQARHYGSNELQKPRQSAVGTTLWLKIFPVLSVLL